MSSTAMQFQTRPRFERTDPRPFELTDRDLEIVRLVARHRFLRSTHVSRLTQSSHKKIYDRLTCLYHAGFLDRPRAQLDYHVKGGGSRPLVYALGNRGAGLLNEHKGRERRQYDWAHKNRQVTRLFLSHALAISDFRVALALAVRNHDEVMLLDDHELLAALPKDTRSLSNPWAWHVRVLNNGLADIGVIPDYAFVLRGLDGKQRAYLVEIDRGTMPVERSSLDQTSVIRKLLAYEAGRQQHLHQKQFAWKNFRVLLLTRSKERVQNISRAIKRVQALKTSPLFLLADDTVLDQANLPFHGWQDARGQRHALWQFDAEA